MCVYESDIKKSMKKDNLHIVKNSIISEQIISLYKLQFKYLNKYQINFLF